MLPLPVRVRLLNPIEADEEVAKTGESRVVLLLLLYPAQGSVVLKAPVPVRGRLLKPMEAVA